MKNENIEKAAYLSTIIMQCTSLAEMLLKDYEAYLLKAGYQSKQAAKQRIKQNAELAKKLRLNLKSIELEMTGKINESQVDAFLDDVGFLNALVTRSYRMVGDSELRRSKLIKTIDKLYPVNKIEL